MLYPLYIRQSDRVDYLVRKPQTDIFVFIGFRRQLIDSVAMAAVSTNERILAASDQNTAILQTLAETEYASSALAQATSYHKDLLEELKVRESALRKLKSSLAKEQREHEEYRDSTMKRLAYRMSGKKEKFNSKAEKEEREYLEAVQKHFSAQQQVDTLKRNIHDAEVQIEELRVVNQRHQDAQNELDRLYDSIFKGPTPEYPEEDRLEAPVEQARSEFGEIQTKLSTGKFAYFLFHSFSTDISPPGLNHR